MCPVILSTLLINVPHTLDVLFILSQTDMATFGKEEKKTSKLEFCFPQINNIKY